MPEIPGSASFRELWALLHDGGMVIETPASDQPAARLALRTVVQLDGDRLVSVDLDALAPLSHYERLRLLVRHRREVRTRSAGMLEGLRRAIFLLRGWLLFFFGATELFNLSGNIVLSAGRIDINWLSLVHAQGPCLALLLGHKLLPYGLRLLHVVTARGLSFARREASAEVHARILRGEMILPPPVPELAAGVGP